MPKKGTATNLAEASSFIYEQLDNSKQVNVIYIDFREAFDSIEHSITVQY